MTDERFDRIVITQRHYFESGITRSAAFRMEMLDRLYFGIKKHETALLDALMQDLHKSRQESYMTEIGIILSEISFHKKHLLQWMKEKRVPTPLSLQPATSFLSTEPYGVSLIISPWNYPVQLCLAPLVCAISAGDCAVIKTSEYAPACSKAVCHLINDCFPQEYITVVEGAVPETAALLRQKFDFIFFTGSPRVGKIVMKAAADHLTPIALELGGKSPVIVDKTANLKLAARRIAYGKYLNAGQICVAPDYVMIEESVMEPFLRYFKEALKRFSADSSFSQMCHIVTDAHFQRLCGLLEGQEIAVGGRHHAADRWMEPTVLIDPAWDSPVMQEEIFGPILPVLTFKSLDACIERIRSQEKPLALYLFSQNKAVIRKVLHSCSFGGGCINDTIMHVSSLYLPFGGVGNSGIGQYHGKAGFDLFSHSRSILKTAANLEVPLRYPPFTEWKDKLVRKFLH